MGPTITLLSDFGERDGYVAAMKGVIQTYAPHAAIVDACHDIGAQDIRAGAWALSQYWTYYPHGTIHVAVVDPGVGSERKALLVKADEQYLIAPDNGILHWAVKKASRVRIGAIKPDIHLPGRLSKTFHGRDVFAYVAALISAGTERFEDITEEVAGIVIPEWGSVGFDGGRLRGEVIHIDHFGNLITNIGRDDLEKTGWSAYRVTAGEHVLSGLSETYSDVSDHQLLCLIGSHENLEISVSFDSAAALTGLHRGDRIYVEEA
ncbi:MAG: SAM-dependent chlorinase/fluorinase [Verrucomicrobia bacterium]|nr:SAM-dependent chlorinase/fluorinase [Verrucomicrobiota bacterium]